jgi:hypothetical protein
MLPISYSTGEAKPSIFGLIKTINEFYGWGTKGKPLGVKGLSGTLDLNGNSAPIQYSVF